MSETKTLVAAPVKSAGTSKINWVQVASALATGATAIITALNLPVEQATTLTAAVAAIGQLVTVVLRTFYTTTVISNSVQGGSNEVS